VLWPLGLVVVFAAALSFVAWSAWLRRERRTAGLALAQER
jgi:hypothetical protein